MLKEKEVDSTRGKSGLDPVNYKGDVLVQVWIDSRVLATLSSWLENLNEYPRFMSEVVRRPLEVLVEHLINKGEVAMIDDTATARRMLQGRYRINLNKGDRGGKNVLHNHILSDRRGELSSRLERGRSTNHVDVAMGGRKANVSPEVMEEMVNRVERSIVSDEDIERGREESKKEKLKELENAMSSNLAVGGGEEVTLKEGMSDEELMKYNEKRDEERVKLERKPIDVKDFNIIKE